MSTKGYTSIQDFRGKLKEWSKDGVAKSREEKKKRMSNGTVYESTTSNNGGFVLSQALNMLLVAVIAILVADKFGHISI